MKDIKPILKWAGGKQTLLSELDSVFGLFDLDNCTYYEPFVGGGSVFLHLQKKNVVINDYNQELINVYNVLQKSPYDLIEKLKVHEKKHNKDYYYKIRFLDRTKDYDTMNNIEKAARTVYLNRTCFNGLMRYNKAGFFNVPIGRYDNPAIILDERILLINEYLSSNNVKIRCGDFSDACSDAKNGDVIYFDPPYDYENNGFTDYTNKGWDRNELNRLKDTCDNLVKKGCHIIVSNNDTKYINELFKEYNIKHIYAHRFINSNGDGRKDAKEVIIYE